MKRISLFFFLLLFSLPLFSSMLIFDLSHPVYSETEALFLVEGKTTALGIKPWSDTDVREMLSYIDPKTDIGKRLYKKIEGYLENSDKSNIFGFSSSFTPSASLHTNPSSFSTYNDWQGHEIDSPLLTIELFYSYSDYLAMFTSLNAGVVADDASSYSDGVWTEEVSRYNKYFAANIPFLYGNFDFNIPKRAYFSIGFSHLRFTAGRDRLSWGSGMLGNMMLSDTLPYHDYFSLTVTGNEYFHYQMLVSFFTPLSIIEQASRSSDYSGLRFFMGHRFEFDLLSHSLKLVLNESIMYYSENGYLDMRVFNPVFLLHDLFLAGNSNSLMTFEAEWAFLNNWVVYTQIAIDDLAMINEPSAPATGATPDEWGAMIGLKGIIPFGGNYFYTGFEFVYTSPFMYHRATGEGESEEYNLYYISSLRIFNTTQKVISRYLSFPFGSDAIAALFRFGYRDIYRFSVESNIMFMAHGIIDKESVIKQYSEDTSSDVTHTPSTLNPFDSEESGEIEYSLVFGAEGEVKINKYFSLSSSLYFNFIWNKDYIKRGAEFDLQMTLTLVFKY